MPLDGNPPDSWQNLVVQYIAMDAIPEITKALSQSAREFAVE